MADKDDHYEANYRPSWAHGSKNFDRQVTYEEAEVEQEQQEEEQSEERTLSDYDARVYAERYLANEEKGPDDTPYEVPKITSFNQGNLDAIMAARDDILNEREAKKTEAQKSIANELTSEDIANIEKGEHLTLDRSGNYGELRGDTFVVYDKDGFAIDELDFDNIKGQVLDREQQEQAQAAEAAKEAKAADHKASVFADKLNSRDIADLEAGKSVENDRGLTYEKQGDQLQYNGNGKPQTVDFDAVKGKVAEREAKIEKQSQHQLSSADVKAIEKGETVKSGAYTYERDKEDRSKVNVSNKPGGRVVAQIDGGRLKGEVERREGNEQFASQRLNPDTVSQLKDGKTLTSKDGTKISQKDNVITIEGGGKKAEVNAAKVEARVNTKFSDAVEKSYDRAEEQKLDKGGEATKAQAATENGKVQEQKAAQAVDRSKNSEANAQKKTYETKCDMLKDSPNGMKWGPSSKGNYFQYDAKTNDIVRTNADGKESGRLPFDKVKEAEVKFIQERDAKKQEAGKEAQATSKDSKKSDAKAKTSESKANQQTNGNSEKATKKKPNNPELAKSIKSTAKTDTENSEKKEKAKAEKQEAAPKSGKKNGKDGAEQS